MQSSTLRTSLLVVVAFLLALSLVGLMIVRSTSAAFEATTSNANNAWATGQVTLTDNDAEQALFSLAADGGLAPGDSQTRCIVVTNQSSTAQPMTVAFGAANGTEATDLNPHLQIRVGAGPALASDAALPAFGACDGYAEEGVVADTPLSTLIADGTAVTSVLAPSQHRIYQFTYTVLDSATPNLTGSALFTWTGTTTG